jgi:hypothetical protein
MLVRCFSLCSSLESGIGRGQWHHNPLPSGWEQIRRNGSLENPAAPSQTPLRLRQLVPSESGSEDKLKASYARSFFGFAVSQLRSILDRLLIGRIVQHHGGSDACESAVTDRDCALGGSTVCRHSEERAQ